MEKNKYIINSLCVKKEFEIVPKKNFKIIISSAYVCCAICMY